MIVLTNGKYYIAHSESGAVIKVPDIAQAEDFQTLNRATRQKKKTPGKCNGYYAFDTIENKKCELRKKFTTEERKAIYRKTRGHCYICGEFVEFDSFEVEHRIPIGKGGTNQLNNLFVSCHCCNCMKGSIYPRDLMEKISQIFLYQMKMRMKNRNSLKYRILYRELRKII